MNTRAPSAAPGRLRRRLTAVLAALILLALGWLAGRRVERPHASGPVAFEGLPEPPGAPIAPSTLERPRNVILVVADGFGFAHLALALHTYDLETSDQQSPVWHRFGVRGWHDPRPAWGSITDSAASATAMATGRLARNGSISVDEDNLAMTTWFEVASQRGYRTGIVTDSYIWDATPAAFATHSPSRDHAEEILRQLAGAELDVLFGELEDVGEGRVPTWQETVGILEERYVLLDESLALPAGLSPDQPIATVHPEDSIIDSDSVPNLLDMVRLAIDRLVGTREPFLLLVETEESDSASHRRNGPRVATAVSTLSAMLEEILDFAQARNDTLVVFTSDHETGGLALGYTGRSYPNLIPLWGTRDHTATVVPLFADGPGAHRFSDVQRVWQIGEALHDLLAVPDA